MVGMVLIACPFFTVHCNRVRVATSVAVGTTSYKNEVENILRSTINNVVVISGLAITERHADDRTFLLRAWWLDC